MTRTRAQHLNEEELNILLDVWRKGMRPSFAAGLVHCSERIAQKYYSLFRSEYGDTAGYNRFKPERVVKHTKPRESLKYQDESFYGPVPHRQCPPPNCIPSLTKQQLMAGR
jgi:hypothetical protein